MFLRSFITGFLLSACLVLASLSGLILTYRFMPFSVYLSIGLTVAVLLMFWLIMKYDHYLDINEVFFKTIARDFKSGNFSLNGLFVRFVKPFNPFIGALGAIMLILLLLCVVPSLIIYAMVPTELARTGLKVYGIIISFCISTAYLFSNKRDFPLIADRVLYFSGIIAGAGLSLLII